MSKLALIVVWLILASIIVCFSAIPISVEAQFILAFSAIGLMIFTRIFRLHTKFRYLYIGLSVIIVLRYFSWRLVYTVPSPENIYNFIPGVLLLLAELYCFSMLLMSLFVIISPLRRNTIPFTDAEAPVVDVFVPTYNETIEILGVTLAAAKEMSYPREKLNVYLLDDGGTDARLHSDNILIATNAANRRAKLQDLCRDLGVTYVTRAENIRAKAGNLNNGLSVTNGELVAVFDADHAPAREFLQETVGQFLKEDRLFLVQTPHFFLNPDPIEKNLGTFKRMPSENEMFYSIVQRGLDKWNASFFCGSAAVLRREAIEQVGGFAGESITEDCETALELHSRGWKSAFIDKPMIAGLQPETFEAFIGQRSRWCQGMIQILLLKNPLFKSGLTFAQRICYMSSILYWLFPVVRFIFLISPMFFIFFDLKIYVANKQEFLAYTLPYMISAVMLQNHNFGRFRWPWISDVYEYVQSLYLLAPLVSVFLNPRKPAFNVTAKGQTLERDHISPLALPQFAVYGLVLASSVYLARRYGLEPANRDLFGVVGLWTGLNLILTSIGLGIVCELRERRSAPRVSTTRAGQIEALDGSMLPVIIDDVSISGAAVRIPGLKTNIRDLKAFGELTLCDLSGAPVGGAVSCEIRSRAKVGDTTVLGIEFVGDISSRARMVAELVFADLKPLREARATRNVDLGVIGGTLIMLSWAFRQTMRCVTFVVGKRAANKLPVQEPAKQRAVA
jgi:cellulose synthase (UDP-forming)